MAYKNIKKQNPSKQYNPKSVAKRLNKPKMLPSTLTISGSKCAGTYHFSCGNSVPIYEVGTVHALNQVIGHAKFNNQSYGNVYYRGECTLHPSLKPSLFRKGKNTEKATERISQLIQRFVNDTYMQKELKIVPGDFETSKCKIEGMLQLIQTAANAVSSTIEEKKTFQTNAAELIRLMKYADRGDIAPEVRTRYEAITAIYGELKKKRKTASNVDLMVEINNIISEYVHVEDAASGMVLSRQFDISQIDFDLLRREFAKTKKKNLVMKDLAELIRSRLDSMLLNNPDRIIYHERYQQIIEDYNSQQDRATIEKTFDELMQIVKDMDQEERRYVREGFSSDEELSLYDMLFSENLSKQDIRKIKAVAVELLQKVKSKIAELDHWTDKQETRSIVYNLIRDDLWSELPACYDEPSISVYLQRIYEYVYKRYKEVA